MLKVIKHVTADVDVLVVRWEYDTWTFCFNGDDPGYDFLVTPQGVVYDAYDPYGGVPTGCPEALWTAIQEYFESTYG